MSANADITVVGAGVYGLTMAERLAHAGLHVELLEKRGCIGGNCHSFIDDATNIEVHAYGPHIFHTSNTDVWEYVNAYTSFVPYNHRVYTTAQGRVYSMPVNLHTINQVFGTHMTPDEARAFIASRAKTLNVPANAKEKAISLVGEELYHVLFAGYTEKQWGTNPEMLPPEIISRLPVRYSYDNRYFDDTYQGLPTYGYANWFANIIEQNARIDLKLNTALDKSSMGDHLIIYTGPIDEFFDYKFGALGWRTIDFLLESKLTSDYQGTAVMNYADAGTACTRVTEYKHFRPDRPCAKDKTLIMRESPRFATREDEPLYPISTEEDKLKLSMYKDYAKKVAPNVIFGGRLGLYRYMDMDDAIAHALVLASRLLHPSSHMRRFMHIARD